MNERHWDRSIDIDAMLRLLKSTQKLSRSVKDRKLRLAAIAFARLWPQAELAPGLDVVFQVSERLSEGAISWAGAFESCMDITQSPTRHIADILLGKNSAGMPERIAHAIRWTTDSLGDPCRSLSDPCLEPQPKLLRDIFGNPFRPMAFDPKWRTEAAVGLAGKMYDERDFRAMPILSDALEEAGCDSAELLTHCRESGVHVRGCWVVDLVLGKV